MYRMEGDGIGLLEVGTSEAEERNPQKKIVEQGEG